VTGGAIGDFGEIAALLDLGEILLVRLFGGTGASGQGQETQQRCH
jgi:hypothetical protein